MDSRPSYSPSCSRIKLKDSADILLVLRMIFFTIWFGSVSSLSASARILAQWMVRSKLCTSMTKLPLYDLSMNLRKMFMTGRNLLSKQILANRASRSRFPGLTLGKVLRPLADRSS